MKEISLFDFYDHFSDEQSCKDYIARLRWGDKIICPHCETNKTPYVTNRGYCCSEQYCRKKFTVTVGTLFENSKQGLRIWFNYIFYQASNKKNLSSHQQAKNLGVSQKTMWIMQHKLRSVLNQDDSIRFTGTVEIDEAFLSKGGQKWTRWGGLCTRKEPILGLRERETNRVIIKTIPDRKRETILSLIERHIEPGSIIYTDGAPVYKKLHQNYTHESVEHSTREYVRGDIHTNNIELVWRMLKSNIRHAHHSVSAKHVQIYCDELCYRLNTKEMSASERFDDMLLRCIPIIPKKDNL